MESAIKQIEPSDAWFSFKIRVNSPDEIIRSSRSGYLALRSFKIPSISCLGDTRRETHRRTGWKTMNAPPPSATSWHGGLNNFVRQRTRNGSHRGAPNSSLIISQLVISPQLDAGDELRSPPLSSLFAPLNVTGELTPSSAMKEKRKRVDQSDSEMTARQG